MQQAAVRKIGSLRKKERERESTVPLGAGGEEFGAFAHADFTLLLLGGVCFFLGLLVGGRR